MLVINRKKASYIFKREIEHKEHNECTHSVTIPLPNVPKKTKTTILPYETWLDYYEEDIDLISNLILDKLYSINHPDYEQTVKSKVLKRKISQYLYKCSYNRERNWIH